MSMSGAGSALGVLFADEDEAPDMRKSRKESGAERWISVQSNADFPDQQLELAEAQEAGEVCRNFVERIIVLLSKASRSPHAADMVKEGAVGGLQNFPEADDVALTREATAFEKAGSSAQDPGTAH